LQAATRLTIRIGGCDTRTCLLRRQFGFVEPATGRTVWNIANAVCKELFELILVDFARSVGAGDDKRIVLQLDNAGWHGPENLAVPDGIRLVFQPAHSPELQPAEHLWQFVDEPLANRCFATIESLDHAVGQRCLALTHQCDTIRDSTLFHWWPRQPPSDKPGVADWARAAP
jgi:hypothetical protein